MTILLRHALACVALLWLSLAAHGAGVQAEAPAAVRAAVMADWPPPTPLGAHMVVLEETAAPMTLADVLRTLGTGHFVAAPAAVIGAGIGHRPIWTHLVVDNPTGQPLTRLLAVGPTWLDQLDAYVLHPGQGTTVWHTGDAVAGVPQLDEALGYVFAHRFLPGRSDVLLRAATADPLVLDVRLLTPERATRAAAVERYAYGFLYGFLASLIIYNLILYFGLGRRNSLYYSIYLFAFVALNLAYTGRGLAWLWPEETGLQRYIILILMVLVAGTGLRFAREFLEMDEQTPRLARVVRWFCRTALALMLVAILVNQQEAAAWLAFVVMGIFAVAMIGLGGYALRRGQHAAGYFLVAAIASMAGVSLTLFSVWGFIPFNTWTYRGMEVGMMLDATLLALALAKFVRVQMAERQRAERDARIDPLTQLANRRGFVEQAAAACRIAVRHQRPLSLAMVDLDHFKAINDRHGHALGDVVLAQAAAEIIRSARRSDIAARWGGEEFILLLPESDIDAAVDFSERIRLDLENTPVRLGEGTLQITASFGVAQLQVGQDLAALIHAADSALLLAKQTGRNRVVRAESA